MGVLRQDGKLWLAQISLKLRYGVPKINKNVLEVSLYGRSCNFSSPERGYLGWL